jgi:phosphopantothenoylcysteine decarboxylase/phosphopantothenate--cysteine ligase
MKVILGVTGCIAAYKSALVLRLLQEQGHDVVPVMTLSAEEFITPLTLEKLSGHPVITDLFEDPSPEILHISVARESDLLLVAPATANTLAKFAAGIADDFLSTLYLSTTTPVIIAPAMNVEMWRHPATVSSVKTLRERGVLFVDPESGYQACGEQGEGRLADPARVVSVVQSVFEKTHSLDGKSVLITAGPTIEDVDPVRFLSNRSSGKMGYALAAEASSRGASVHLISGPSALEPPPGVKVTRVRSAEEMAGQSYASFPSADVVIKAAAVADYTPVSVATEKTKKTKARWVLELQPTEDILHELGRRKENQLLVGFAAESENLIENAQAKLRQKNLDLIVANDISQSESGFEVDQNQVVLIDRIGQVEELPLLLKSQVAKRILDKVEELLSGPAAISDESNES